MGFFDLNVPYLELPPSDSAVATAQKTNRIKIVIKAMELGFTGVAYNRTIKGVMSDRDRCSIPLLSLSCLLKLAPFLSSSVEFHRDLLGVPRASAFRQYTRITVCVDSSAQSQALNSGNPVLKSYDIVAIRPLNQTSFDHACEKADVDMISIDFSDKLPFRLKQSMVKAAIERGVYFELVYSDLIVDVQVKRQMISSSKLLVVWARGKNLIISSAAPSVCELRGPNDVANLVSLLGLSPEHAKAALSKNCRNLISSALRRKHFYKDAIRVEHVSAEHSVPDKTWSADWLKWDPLSSGEGDLLLDNMADAFSASNKVSNLAEAIDFASVIDTLPSHGFQVKDFISRPEEVSQSLKINNLSSATLKADKVFVESNRISESPIMSIDLSGRNETLIGSAPLDDQNLAFEDSPKVGLVADATKHFTSANVAEAQKVTLENEFESAKGPSLLPSAERCDVKKETSGNKKTEVLQVEVRDDQESNSDLNVGMLAKNSTYQTLVRCDELGENLKADSSLEVTAPSNATSWRKESQVASNIDVGLLPGNDRMDVDMDVEDLRSASVCSSEKARYTESGSIAITPDPISSLKSNDKMRMVDDSAAANAEETEVNMMVTGQETGGTSSSLNETLDGNSLEREAVSVDENYIFLAGEVPVAEFDLMKANNDASTSTYEAQGEALDVLNHEGHGTERKYTSGVEYLSDLNAGRARAKRRPKQIHLFSGFMRFLRPVFLKRKAKIHRHKKHRGNQFFERAVIIVIRYFIRLFVFFFGGNSIVCLFVRTHSPSLFIYYSYF